MKKWFIVAISFCAVFIFTNLFFVEQPHSASKNATIHFTSSKTAASSKPIKPSADVETQSNSNGTSEPPIHIKPKVINEDISQQLHEWRKKLAKSSATDDLLTHAIIGRKNDLASNTDFLFNLLETSPTDNLLNYVLIEKCLYNNISERCQSVAKKALSHFDTSNGATNDLKAIIAYKNGNHQAALEALTSSNLTNSSDFYWWQYLKLIGNSMSDHGVRKNKEFFLSLFGMSAAIPSKIAYELNVMCMKQSTKPNWKKACYKRGHNLSVHGLSNYTRHLGFAIKTYSSNSDEERQKIEADYLAYDTNAQLVSDELIVKLTLSQGWEMNDTEWNEYLATYQTTGELDALRYLNSLL